MSEIKRDFFRSKWLFWAAIFGDVKKIKKLIEEKVDVNSQDEEGHTALYLAVWNGHEEATRLLAAAGADIDLRDKSGMTPLHIAAFLGIIEIVELLLVLGADREAKDNHGKTPLDKAQEFKSQKAHRKIVELLKK